MDSFWTLSSPDAKVRAKSSHQLITSLFPGGTEADVKYAYNRLFKGLNSGRAAARQGYAGALSMLLQKLKELKDSTDSQWSPSLSEIFTTLKTSTSPPTPTKKGAESRDYIFGTLFGLLSIARSAILQSATTSEVKPFVELALQLYAVKKWLRETAVHAVAELLGSVGEEVKKELVETVVGKFVEESPPTAETLYLTLSLNLAPLTPQLLKSHTQNLLSTSSTYPRLHIVWPTLLTSSLSTPPLLSTLFTSLISPQMTHSTLERKSLVLLLLQHLPSRLPDSLVPVVFDGRVGKLLLNCANGDTKNVHTLRELGLKTLSLIKSESSQRSPQFKFKLAASLLLIDSRFDAKTRTDTVKTLLSSLDSSARIEYVDFLKSQITSQAEIKGDEEVMGKVKNKVEAFSDLLCGAAKMFEGEGEEGGEVVKDVLGFFMAFSFFDCTNVKVPDSVLPEPPKKKGKKGKKAAKPATPPPISPAVSFALQFKSSAPHSLRTLTSSRFFSLLSHLTSPPTSLPSSTSLHLTCHSMWLSLESSSCPLHRPPLPEDSMSTRLLASTISQLTPSQPKLLPLSNLTLCLTILLLNEGPSSPLNLLDDEDNLDDLISSSTHDLVSGYTNLLNVDVPEMNKEEEGLDVVADVCVGILGMHTESGGRGSSVKMVRDSVKRCWGGILGEVEGLEGEVVRVLVEGVVGEIEEEEGEEEEEDEMDVEEDEGVFQKLAEMDEGGDKDEDEDEENAEDSDDDSNSNGSESDSDESSVELDADALNKMLLGSDDEGGLDDDEEDLQHHSGADGALAAMLKATQQTRKKGAMQRLQLDVDHKQRCLGLLEAALNKNKVGSGLYDIMVQMLKCRREMINASQGVSKSAAAVGGAKKQLADKIMKLFTSKICKMKAPNDVSSEKLEKCFAELAREGKRSPDSAHSNAAGLAMATCLRHSGGEIKGEEEVYSDLINDWSTNKKSKVHSNLFEEVLVRLGDAGFCRGASLLLPGLSACVQNGKNDYVKSEAFRIAAKIYADSRSTPDGFFKSSLPGLCSGVESLDKTAFKAKRIPLIVQFCNAAVQWSSTHTLHCNLLSSRLSSFLGSLIEESGSGNLVEKAKDVYKRIEENKDKEKTTEGKGKKKKGKKK
ncbi:hypothetical protein TrST_g11045 [Triparma strigata]|uniref:DNA polymerase V n=1 Tax=Triparma strigata TaxID=1606541 RepID=A0A9W7DR16_9STRA|nr:hypothetical protein TrST_g11045 [Triparma strigata]